MAGAPAPQEGAFVGLDGDAVEIDRLLERGARHRDEALLVGVAQHEKIRRDGIAHQRGGDAGAVQERSDEHTSALQSLMRFSYAVLCMKQKTTLHALTLLSSDLLSYNYVVDNYC